jgi:hypothetical protein
MSGFSVAGSSRDLVADLPRMLRTLADEKDCPRLKRQWGGPDRQTWHIRLGRLPCGVAGQADADRLLRETAEQIDRELHGAQPDLRGMIAKIQRADELLAVLKTAIETHIAHHYRIKGQLLLLSQSPLCCRGSTHPSK